MKGQMSSQAKEIRSGPTEEGRARTDAIAYHSGLWARF
jgi:hypothetical protein